MTKLSSLSKPGGIGHPFDLTSFSARPVQFLATPFFTPGVFLIRYNIMEMLTAHVQVYNLQYNT